MDDHGIFQFFHARENFFHFANVVAVERTDVFKSQIHEQIVRKEKAFDSAFQAKNHFLQKAAERQMLDNLVDAAPNRLVLNRHREAAQISRKRAFARRNRHSVVVQNDYEIRRNCSETRSDFFSSVEQAFVGKPASERAVSDDGNYFSANALNFARLQKPEALRNRSGSVPVVKKIVLAFAPFREAGNSPAQPNRSEIPVAASEQFVGVALMAHVPNNRVARRRKAPVKRESEFHHAKIARQMSAIVRDGIYYMPPDFLRQRAKFFLGKIFYLFRRIDFSKQDGSP